MEEVASGSSHFNMGTPPISDREVLEGIEADMQVWGWVRMWGRVHFFVAACCFDGEGFCTRVGWKVGGNGGGVLPYAWDQALPPAELALRV